ncbi:MAG: preprotein translocase subunit SecG [Dehalococcoidia bacterium]
MDASNILNVFQILTAIVLITAVLAQAKGSGLGNIFGGGGGGADTFRTRRGVERILFRGTIVLMTLFIVLSIAAVRV